MARNQRPNEPPMPETLAYFMTWPTYGTWLPGDQRGWVQYKEGKRDPDATREFESKIKMTEDACVLDAEQREVVKNTIERHCEIRGWNLRAVNCRSNHLHIVVSADRSPNDIRKQFKAWCTRHLKQMERDRGKAEKDVRQNWWAERGSCRHIGDENSLESAMYYVDELQDLKHLDNKH